MSQHFLLSAEARSLSVREVFGLRDEAAFRLFRELRWGKDGPVVCPACAVAQAHWFLPSRLQWRCKACGHTFSVTSGTIFAHHKLPLRISLAAVALYTNAVKGLSALQMGRDLGVQYKTAFVLMHKVRESLLAQREEGPLAGEVQMDGAYGGGHVRPQNKQEDRLDRRLAEHQSPEKRCILVLRENHPKVAESAGAHGARRTLSFVIRRENQADVGTLARRFIAPGTVISTDESDAYELLHAHFPMRRVNHQVAYRGEDGTTNNQAESYFSRFRCVFRGKLDTDSTGNWTPSPRQTGQRFQGKLDT